MNSPQNKVQKDGFGESPSITYVCLYVCIYLPTYLCVCIYYDPNSDKIGMEK